MQNKKDVWLYSWDDEYFASDEFESKEEAIEAAKKELKMFGYLEENVYIGKREDVSLPGVDTEDVLERVQELIDNEFDEYGEDWITRIKDEDRKILDDRLNKVFENWINEFGYKPSWFTVTDKEEIELNEVANED